MFMLHNIRLSKNFKNFILFSCAKHLTSHSQQKHSGAEEEAQHPCFLKSSVRQNEAALPGHTHAPRQPHDRGRRRAPHSALGLSQ